MNDNKLNESIKSAVDNGKVEYFDGMDEAKPSVESFYAKAAGENGSTERNVQTKSKKRVRYSMFAVAACLVLVMAVVVNNNNQAIKNIIPTTPDTVFTVDNRKVKPVETIVVDSDYKNLYEELENTQGAYFNTKASEMIVPMEAESGMDMGAPVAGGGEAAAEAPAADIPTPDASPDYNVDAPAIEDSREIAADEVITPGASTDFSETNTQVEGVGEADIIKTDGEYIYVLNSKNIIIAKANAGNPEVVSKIPQVLSNPSDNIYCEMYVTGDRLIAIKSGYGGSIIYPDGSSKSETVVDIFDISDKANPEKMKGMGQSGYYSDSRLIGNKLYLISSYSELYYETYDEIEPRTYVPLYIEDGDTIACPPADIRMMPGSDYPSYTLINSIDIDSAESISKESLLGDYGEVYCSNESIYLTSYKYIGEERQVPEGKMYLSSSETLVTKYSLNDGKIEHVASASVPGSILNQFSMDEYKGNFRIVTSEFESYWIERRDAKNTDIYSDEDFGEKNYNSLYVLNSSLEQIGSVEELAPDENVYSCRFMGDIAYFVTFKQVDPLFSVDLSDPTKPTVVGVLKIPGFSEYLHPYDTGLLFGIGKDADEETGMTKSLKLTMFDNSDPTDVKEKHTLIIEDVYYSPAEYNHKAILINKNKGIVAFPTEEGYQIYKYDANSGFEKVVEVKIDPNYADQLYAMMEVRGLFIDDIFYVISPNTIKTFDMNNDFTSMNTVSIDEGAASPVGNNIIMPLAMPEVDGQFWIE